jgi:hypothetical protein
LASITVDDVHDTINISAVDISDTEVLKMIKRVEVTPELELSREIDYADCSDAEKELITLLAAVYAIC